jgi:predicted DNA-binding protein (MmcQ/YjbR family)
VPPSTPLDRLREVCLSFPESHEVEAWGEPTFRVKNKIFAMYASANDHHGDGRVGVWLKAAPGNQDLMIQFAPKRFFVPPYVGKSGWVGVYLDTVCDWTELPELVRDAYLLTAPKKLRDKVAPGS